MATRARASRLAGVAAAGLLVTVISAPHGQADPDLAEQEASGTYRLVFDNAYESPRTWQITPHCEVERATPCVRVVGNGTMAFDAVLADGRWSFGSSYAMGPCAAPPVTVNVWSWDPIALNGTVVNDIEAGCGLPERTETYSTFTMTRIG